MKDSVFFKNANTNISSVGEIIHHNSIVDFGTLNYGNISCINTHDDRTFKRPRWDMKPYRLVFNGKYNAWTLLLNDLHSDDETVELYDHEVLSIEYTKTEIYKKKDFTMLNLSEKGWEEAISLMRGNGWKDAHELLIRRRLFEIWELKGGIKSSDAAGQLDYLKYQIESSQDKVSDAKFVLLASSDICECLHVSGELVDWKVWVQGSSNWGRNVIVRVKGPDNLEVDVPKENSWSDREYLHQCSKLLEIINNDKFNEGSVEYISSRGLAKFYVAWSVGLSF